MVIGEKMIYTVENEKIKVCAEEKGAELQSIVLKKNGKEYLWQGTAPYWDGKAYNLFPICGRLTDGKYTYKGMEYKMGSHGFVRKSVLKGELINDSEMLFTLIPDEGIKAQYPFDFVYTVRYIIKDTTVTTEYTVKNTGNEPMYFALGGHPGFNVPIFENESFDDYYLEFDSVTQIKKLVFTPLFDTGKTEPAYLTNGMVIEMYHKMFDNDGLFYTDMSKAITLRSKKSDVFVRVEYPEFENLGLWHTTGSEAPFICIEPWSSVPAFDGVVDDLESKKQMFCLKKGETHTMSFDITIG